MKRIYEMTDDELLAALFDGMSEKEIAIWNATADAYWNERKSVNA